MIPEKTFVAIAVWTDGTEGKSYSWTVHADSSPEAQIQAEAQIGDYWFLVEHFGENPPVIEDVRITDSL